MKSRILLIGKNGQIGAELAMVLPALGEVIALDRRQLDLSKPDAIRETIRDLRPALIVNAAAYTAVDQAEKQEAVAQTLNADAPALIAREAKKIGAGVVHFSTDYVFDGLKTSPYQEDDPPNPTNVYGRTKLAGEQGIRDAEVPHLILRTSWVYATRGRNFLLTILRLATQREELRIVDDQYGAPTWCRGIAEATTSILERQVQKQADEPWVTEVSGTYHMTAAGVTTWCGFARAILEEASLEFPWVKTVTNGLPFRGRLIVPITTADYPTPAHRPAYSVLSNSRLNRVFGLELSNWRAQLRTAMTTDNTPGYAEARAE
jgi:dTDP-4-dehydrorhamnose reductase